jgi:hypothetical protein
MRRNGGSAFLCRAAVFFAHENIGAIDAKQTSVDDQSGLISSTIVVKLTSGFDQAGLIQDAECFILTMSILYLHI